MSKKTHHPQTQDVRIDVPLTHFDELMGAIALGMGGTAGSDDFLVATDQGGTVVSLSPGDNESVNIDVHEAGILVDAITRVHLGEEVTILIRTPGSDDDTPDVLRSWVISLDGILPLSALITELAYPRDAHDQVTFADAWPIPTSFETLTGDHHG